MTDQAIPQAFIDEWIATINLNQWVIEQQVKDLTHANTLLELPFRGNTMNWVLGHLAEHRDWMLRAVSETTLMPAKQVMLYRRSSDPLQASDAVDLATLLQYLTQSRDVLVTTLSNTNEDFLMEKPTDGILNKGDEGRTRFQRLQGLQWHETYHIGQLEPLRQLAGMDDHIIYTNPSSKFGNFRS